MNTFITDMGTEYKNSVFKDPSLCVGDMFQKNTTQIETTQSELGFFIASHVKFEDGFQGYKNTNF